MAYMRFTLIFSVVSLSCLSKVTVPIDSHPYTPFLIFLLRDMLSQISKCVHDEENTTLGKCRVNDSRIGSLPSTTVIWRMRVLTEERAVTKEKYVLCTMMAFLNLCDYYFHIDCVKLICRFRICARCPLYHSSIFSVSFRATPKYF